MLLLDLAPKQEKHIGRRPSNLNRKLYWKDTVLLVALRDVRVRAVCVCSGRLPVVGFFGVSLVLTLFQYKFLSTFIGDKLIS